jgi:hypothetical protein
VWLLRLTLTLAPPLVASWSAELLLLLPLRCAALL